VIIVFGLIGDDVVSMPTHVAHITAVL